MGDLLGSPRVAFLFVFRFIPLDEIIVVYEHPNDGILLYACPVGRIKRWEHPSTEERTVRRLERRTSYAGPTRLGQRVEVRA